LELPDGQINSIYKLSMISDKIAEKWRKKINIELGFWGLKKGDGLLFLRVFREYNM